MELFIGVICTLLLFNLLWWHWKIGLVRYFDVDEFAHLHWAYHIFIGKKPYIDFLFFFPPVYHWFLAPVFWFGSGLTPIIAARVLSFAVFGGLVGATIYLFWNLRKSALAVFAGAVLAFLPLPFDKFVEIRPDTLATLVSLIGLIFAIKAIDSGKDKDWGIAGFWYSLSVLILTKTVPPALVLIGIFLLWLRGKSTGKIRSVKIFGTGLALPFIIFGLWLLSLGNLDQVIYSLTKLPVEANMISKYFIMLPDLFFYPNAVFYGEGGYNSTLLVNHLVWIVGILMGVYRFFLPYYRGKKHALEEWAISSTFIVQIISYVLIFPLKHTQYLIPIAVFVAWYSADFLDFVWQLAQKSWQRVYVFGTIIAISFILYRVNTSVSTIKATFTNTQALQSLAQVYKTIPISEPILDLDGSMIYYPDPYFVCCIPFGQFGPLLSKPLPSLAEVLEDKKVKYIWQGGLKRVGTLQPADQAYISEHYGNWDSEGNMLARKP